MMTTETVDPFDRLYLEKAIAFEIEFAEAVRE